MFKWKLSNLGRLQSNIEQEKNLPYFQLQAFVARLMIMSDLFSCCFFFFFTMKFLKGEEDGKKCGEEEEKISKYTQSDHTKKQAR